MALFDSISWFDVDGDIETFYTYCLRHMEGCDEPEWTMFNQITIAIEDYWLKKHSNTVNNAIEDTIAQMPNALKMLENS